MSDSSDAGRLLTELGACAPTRLPWLVLAVARDYAGLLLIST